MRTVGSFFQSRLARDIREDQQVGPAVLERLLSMLTVTMLVVLVMSTFAQGLLTMFKGLSGRVGLP